MMDSAKQPDQTQTEAQTPETQTPVAEAENLETPVETTASEETPEAGTEELSAAEYEQVIATLQNELSALRQKNEAQAAQLDSYKGQYARIAADFDNFRKRSQNEKQDLEFLTKKNTLSELLAVVDSFERARFHIKPGNDGEMTIHQSYQGVYKQLVDAFKKLGVSAMRSEGESFDPNLHEAVYQEVSPQHEEGTVIEQVVRGYLLNDKILRHAMVKVAAPGSGEEVNTDHSPGDTAADGETNSSENQE